MTRSTTSTTGWARTLPGSLALDRLLDRIGHRFGDLGLLELALTHRSWCAENSSAESNERLEFLGDSVLGLAVTEELYLAHPDRPEGDLARMRAALVNSVTLAEVAKTIELGASLRLGKGEDSSGGRERASILADSLEAVLGAVHLDGGWPAARSAVGRLMKPWLDSAQQLESTGDYKTRLQELASMRFGGALPVYSVAGSGPDHDKEFRAEVRLAGQIWGVGTGRSKKLAEQAAAGAAYTALVADERDPDRHEEGTGRDA